MEHHLAEVEEQLLSEIEEECLNRDGTRPRISRRISRRQLFRSSAGTAVVSAVGIGGLLELLANREAIAAGNVLALVGVTREPSGGDDPHRHTFAVRFAVTQVNASTITGDVRGRTEATISTGDEKEEQHFHLIQGTNVPLEQTLISGPENNEVGEHTHVLSIE